jgi:general secretion pathway protein B
MSFILDALKKSENDRQEHSDSEFKTVPSSPDAPTAPRWLWILGVLLTINIVVVLGLMLRSEQSPNPTSSQIPITGSPSPDATRTVAPTVGSETTQDTTANTEDEQSFNSQIAEARRSQPPQSQPAAEPVRAATPVAQSEFSPVSVENLRVSERASLPSLMELRANGTLQLPELHIDIHVYDTDPANRFAFINMNKYSENSQLDEGPLLKEITVDGVILEHRGYAFILPRD